MKSFSQRKLAEITEMIRTSHLVHKGLVNMRKTDCIDPAEEEDMTFGNKIALLTGDYLLGHSSAELAGLKNQEVRFFFYTKIIIAVTQYIATLKICFLSIYSL